MKQNDKIFSCQVDDGIAIVEFNIPSEKINTWTNVALDDFVRMLDALEEQKKGLKGVIFISGKATNFHAGANLKFIAG